MNYISSTQVGESGIPEWLSVREDPDPKAFFQPTVALWSFKHDAYITFNKTTGAMTFTQTAPGWNEQVQIDGNAYLAFPGASNNESAPFVYARRTGA